MKDEHESRKTDVIITDDGNKHEIVWGEPLGSHVEGFDVSGVVVIGRYTGSRTVKVKDGHSSIHRLRLVQIWHPEDRAFARGTMLEFWGSTVLDSALQMVLEGYQRRGGPLVRIEYLGVEGRTKLWDVRTPVEGGIR